MTDSSAKYQATQSSEDQPYHSGIRERAEVGGEDLCLTSGRIENKGQTKWTYFLLGCAILLPWSSTSFSPPILFVLMSTQLWKTRRRFSCLDWLVPRSMQPSPRTGRASSH